jgi:LmbE family N-acetylglucosaminyl deacetylase
LLVLAPHPDDEVLGCGGLLALAHRMGWRSRVVIASDGGLGGDPATREAESMAAVDVLAAGGQRVDGPTRSPISTADSNGRIGSAVDGMGPSIEFWRLPDRGLVPGPDLVQRIRSSIAASQANWVVAPSPFEVHPDHRGLCRATIEAMSGLRSSGCDAELILCEIGQPLVANMLVDITEVAATKAQAMTCFASQLKQQAYHEQVAGLNRQRSYTLGPAVTHAEGYWRVSPEDLADGVDGVLAGIVRQLARRL